MTAQRRRQLELARQANSAAIQSYMAAVPSFHDVAWPILCDDNVYIVGAGPTLPMVYPLLRERCGPILACLRAHDELCRQGIEPDYTFHCDPQPLSFGVHYPVRRLVLGDHVHPSLLDLPHDDLYCYRNINNPHTQRWHHGPIESGGSVAHDMFCHAALARARSILLCGVDLALPFGAGDANKHHAPGMCGGELIPPSTVLALDWNGQACVTLPLYQAYANWFAMASRHKPKGHVWAVVGGTLRIPGWDHVVVS